MVMRIIMIITIDMGIMKPGSQDILCADFLFLHLNIFGMIKYYLIKLVILFLMNPLIL